RARATESGRGFRHRMHTHPLRQLLATANRNARESGLRDYFTVFPRLVDGSDYAGADMTGNWYHRNIRIYANILRSCEPGDRLLLLIGAGHIAPLLHFFETSGEFVVDDVLPYLDGGRHRRPAAGRHLTGRLPCGEVAEQECLGN